MISTTLSSGSLIYSSVSFNLLFIPSSVSKFQLLYSLALVLFIPTLFYYKLSFLTLSIHFLSWVLSNIFKIITLNSLLSRLLNSLFFPVGFHFVPSFWTYSCHLICLICCFCFYVYGMLVAFPNLGRAVSLGEFLCVPAVHSFWSEELCILGML